MDILAAQVGGALKAHGLMLVTAESCTGGGVAHALTEISGSSAWFERGFITYSNESKREQLDVQQETLLQHGAVSEAVVREMVAGALHHSHAQIALAVSGIAGPSGGSAGKTGRHSVVRLGHQGWNLCRAAAPSARQPFRDTRPVSAHRIAGRAGSAAASI